LTHVKRLRVERDGTLENADRASASPISRNADPKLPRMTGLSLDLQS